MKLDSTNHVPRQNAHGILKSIRSIQDLSGSKYIVVDLTSICPETTLERYSEDRLTESDTQILQQTRDALYEICRVAHYGNVGLIFEQESIKIQEAIDRILDPILERFSAA